MDLSTLNVPETATIHLEFPGMGKLYADDAKSQPVTIEVYGPASNQAVDYRRKMSRKVQSEMAKRGNRGLSNLGDLEEQELERLCALTAGVSGLIYKGETITKDTVRKVYADPKMGWIRDQLNEKLSGWEDFLA